MRRWTAVLFSLSASTVGIVISVARSAPPPAVTAFPDNIHLGARPSALLDLLANDTQGSGRGLTVNLNTSTVQGLNVIDQGYGALLLTPATSGSSGDVTFSYTLGDGFTTSTAQVRVCWGGASCPTLTKIEAHDEELPPDDDADAGTMPPPAACTDVCFHLAGADYLSGQAVDLGTAPSGTTQTIDLVVENALGRSVTFGAVVLGDSRVMRFAQSPGGNITRTVAAGATTTIQLTHVYLQSLDPSQPMAPNVTAIYMAEQAPAGMEARTWGLAFSSRGEGPLIVPGFEDCAFEDLCLYRQSPGTTTWEKIASMFGGSQVCSLAPAQACSSDADCATGAGSCVYRGLIDFGTVDIGSTKTAPLALVYNSVAATGAPLPLQALEASPFRILADGLVFTGGAIAPGAIKLLALEAAPATPTEVSRDVVMIAGYGGSRLGLRAKVIGKHVGASCERCEIFIGGIKQPDGSLLDFGTQPSGSTVTVEGFVRNDAEVTAVAGLSVNGDNGFFRVQPVGAWNGNTIPAHGQIAFTMEVLFWPGARNATLVLREPLFGVDIYASVHLTSTGEGPLPEDPRYPDCLTSKFHYCIFLDGKLADGLAKLQCSDGSGPCPDSAGLSAPCHGGAGVCLLQPALPDHDEPAVHHKDLALLGSSRTAVAIVNNMEAGFPFQVAQERGSVKVLKNGVPINQSFIYCSDGSGPCAETAFLGDPCGAGGTCKPALFVDDASSEDRIAEFEVDHQWQPAGGTAGGSTSAALGVVDLILSNVHLTHSLYFVANCPDSSFCSFVRLQPNVAHTIGPRGVAGRQGDWIDEEYVLFNGSPFDILATNVLFWKNGSSGWFNFQRSDGSAQPQSDTFDLPNDLFEEGPGLISSPRVHVETVSVRPGAAGTREELAHLLFQGSYVGFDIWRATSDPGRDPYPDCAGSCLFRAPDETFDGFVDLGPGTFVGVAGQAARPVIEVNPNVAWAGAFQVVNDSNERRRIDLEIVQTDGAFSFGTKDGAPILLDSLWLEPETGSQRIWLSVTPQFLQSRDRLVMRSRPARDEAATPSVLEVDLTNTPDRPHGECRGVCLYVDGVRQPDGAAIELLGWTETSGQRSLHVVNGAAVARPYEAILRGATGFIEEFPDVALRCGGDRTSECRGTLAPGAFADLVLEYDLVEGSASQPVLDAKAGADAQSNAIVLVDWARPTVEVISPQPPTVVNCKPRECWCSDAVLANMWLEADAVSEGPGGIQGVSFSLDGAPVGPLLTEAPYAHRPDWDLDCPTAGWAGTCTVTATAFDPGGAVSSAPVEVAIEDCEPAPDALTLLSPRDGQLNVEPIPGFEWTVVGGAAWYEVTVKDAAGHSWVASLAAPPATWSAAWTGATPAPATLELGASYTWQVVARTADARRESAEATFKILRPGMCAITNEACIEGEGCGRCLNVPTRACETPNARDPLCGPTVCSNNPNQTCTQPLDCGGGTCAFDFECSWHVTNDPAHAEEACAGEVEGAACHSSAGTVDGWCHAKACTANEDCAAKTCSNHPDQVCAGASDCGNGVCARDRAWDYGLGTEIVCGGQTADRGCGVCENDPSIGCFWTGGGASWDCSRLGVFASTGESCDKGELTGVCSNPSSFSCSAGASHDAECQGGDVVPGVTRCADGAGTCLAASCEADSDCGEKRCGLDWEEGARCNANGDCGGGTCKAGTPRAGQWCNSDPSCGRGVCPPGSSANAGAPCFSDATCNAGGTGSCEGAPAGTTCVNDLGCGKCYHCTAGAAHDKECDAEGQPCGATGLCELAQGEGCVNGWQCGSEGRCPSSGAACSAGATCGRCQFNAALACTAVGGHDPSCGSKRCSNWPNLQCGESLDCGGGACVVDKQCSWHLTNDPANAVSACSGRADGAACHWNGSVANGWCSAKPCASGAECDGKACQGGPLAGVACTTAGDCGAGTCTRNKVNGAVTCSGTTSAANTQCGVCSQDSSIGCFFSGVTAASWDCSATGKLFETNATCTQGQSGGACSVGARFVCSAGAAYDAECRTGSAVAGVTACGPGGAGKCYSPPCFAGKDSACGGLHCGTDWLTGAACNEGADCGTGTCKAGTTNAGQACTVGTQCEGGAAAATCGPAATANAGGACTSDAQCNAGGGGSCALGGLGGGACTSDMQCGTCASDANKGCASGWDCGGAGQCTAVANGDKTCTAGQTCGKCPNGFRCNNPGLPDAACGSTVCSNNQSIACDATDVAATCGAGTCKPALSCENPNRTSAAEKRALCKDKTAGAQCERFYNGFSWVWATCMSDPAGEACSGNASCEAPTCENSPGTMCDLNGDGTVTALENTSACGGKCTIGTASGSALTCGSYNDCGICRKNDGTLTAPYRGCQGSGAGQCNADEYCWYAHNPAITACGVDSAKECTTTPNACQSARTCNAPTCQNAGACAPVETCKLGTDNGGECGFTHKCQSRRNWARGTLGAVASQSSTWGALPASGAADGRLDTISHTDSNAQAWWQVDLGQLRAVDTIKVYNGNACCLARLTNFKVWADTAPCPTVAPWTLGSSAVAVGVSSGQAGAPTVFSFPSRSARCVRVQLAGTNYLHMAEVEVLESLCTFAGASQCAPPTCNATQCQPQFNCTGDPGQLDNCSFPNACATPAQECVTANACDFPTCLNDGACQPDQKCEMGSAAGGACIFGSTCAAPDGDCAVPLSSQCRSPACTTESCSPQFDCIDSGANGCTYEHRCEAPGDACATPRACDHPFCVSDGACQVE